MKLSAAFGLVVDFRYAISVAFLPTIRAIFRSPSLLLRPQTISQVFMSHVWRTFGDLVDEGGRDAKQSLVPNNAYGTVLDVGAGRGHLLNYLNRASVTKYVALEPNTLMHDAIRQLANASGYNENSGSLVILAYGAEEVPSIVSALGGPNSVDTIVSILSFCSIPEPRAVLSAMVDNLLRSGGQLLFYEHVLSPRADVAWWQRFWTPIWSKAFDGCRLDRPTHLWIESLDIWTTRDVWAKEGESEENLFWHRVGRYVKS
ncbi:hypothetical protein HETIRDRAFT_328108 [Heterobasidion irregulare TC 32-1]|uniref:Methyltransferase type 11 domain-containing protein n=1 Tax=Heterobasidion irregulare (strain TC 32-1) TaxID=747525 RepID=W4JSY7_HETIT|nr:uncharacterized protein HETIRDRAFT_328108 [Heterobasidion irregulare TC 32-1]ETW76677.1 hypothetical protein HETIRDRAFT_328108 [Heterobasidion irregulare TC 32-1]